MRMVFKYFVKIGYFWWTSCNSLTFLTRKSNQFAKSHLSQLKYLLKYSKKYERMLFYHSMGYIISQLHVSKKSNSARVLYRFPAGAGLSVKCVVLNNLKKLKYAVNRVCHHFLVCLVFQQLPQVVLVLHGQTIVKTVYE